MVCIRFFFFFLIVTYTRRLSGKPTADAGRADVQGSPISATSLALIQTFSQIGQIALVNIADDGKLSVWKCGPQLSEANSKDGVV